MSFRPTLPVHKKSSTAWLARQSRDPFVKARLSSPSSYRSRAAYKLIELNDKWGRFLSRPSVRSVVDLGAAPGGWSQVVAENFGWTLEAADNAEDFGLREETKVQKRGSWSTGPMNKTTGRGKIVALDLLPMMPIPGVQTLQMDFLAPGSARIVRDALKSSRNPEGTADIVLSDMAANFSGSKIRDSQMSLDICHAVFDFAKGALTVRAVDERGKASCGGILLLKHFAHPLLQEFRKEHLEPNFHLVHYIKPDSSRADSAEAAFRSSLITSQVHAQVSSACGAKYLSSTLAIPTGFIPSKHPHLFFGRLTPRLSRVFLELQSPIARRRLHNWIDPFATTK